MASITKRGESYRITVSCGYSADGKKLRRSKTWTPDSGMTARQTEKELQRQAVLFEREVENGTYLDGVHITFAGFTQLWLTNYAEKRLAPGTLNPYKMRLEKRILPAIGHIKISKLQPHHLMEFYDNLQEDGLRLDERYTPTEGLVKALEAHPVPNIVKLSGLTYKTCQRIKGGHPTTRETAERLCAALEVDFRKGFTPVENKRLSDKTIRHHHNIV